MRTLKYTVAASMLAVALPASAQQLSIATGGTGGVYYPIGGGVADRNGQKCQPHEEKSHQKARQGPYTDPVAFKR